MQTSWSGLFEIEISRAETARQEGNEGMARVCARRAVGIVIGEYFKRRGVHEYPTSAFSRLNLLASQDDISSELRQVIEHLMMRVSAEHTLPAETDLIRDARWLAQALLPPHTSGS